LIIHWPGQKSQQFHHATSHYDLPPTLLTHLFNCTNPYSDYSIGKEITKALPSDYFISRGYVSFAVIEKDRITNIFSTGNFEIDDLTGRQLEGANLHAPVILRAMNDLQRFFEQSHYAKR
jgi:membrane-anchored protein YejM (alkaline phosphatase superfamily)